MARKNRVSVYDGTYHVTTRIANRAMLLKSNKIKDQIQSWILAIAAFCGIEVWGFTIMDNHLHMILHVPPVPKKYWLNPDDEPAAYAFGMRPPESRTPLWQGDSPSLEASPRRPPVGFTLGDDEMLARLRYLYGDKRVAAMAKEWSQLRERGLGDIVDRQKERYCRRMYNLSHYLKTLKENISMWYNKTYGHEGTLWQGRFYSGVIERKHNILAIVAAYVAYNPVKAKIVASPAEWRWSSYGLAVNDKGAEGDRCRTMYERMLGQPWPEVRSTLESVFADELPSGVTPEQLKEWFDDYDEEAVDANGQPRCEVPAYRASQAIRVSLRVFRTGAYITDDLGFLMKVKNLLPKCFPYAGKQSIKRCRAFLWNLPERLIA